MIRCDYLGPNFRSYPGRRVAGDIDETYTLAERQLNRTKRNTRKRKEKKALAKTPLGGLSGT